MKLARPQGEVIVRPIPEHRADEELSRVYRDLKTTLGVPWVGVIIQALAHYQPFLVESWRQFRPVARSHFFERVSNELRMRAWEGMSSSFTIAPQRRRLETGGYSDREVAQIVATLDLFDYGNPKYLILATAIAAGLVEDRGLGTSPAGEPRDRLPRSPIAQIEPIPVMVEEHHAFGDLRSLYHDMKGTLDLPFVNSDYKAMARWPSYLRLAWNELKPTLTEPAYASVRESLHHLALDAVEALPYPYRMDRRAASAVGMGGADIDELCRTISLFQWLLSGVILNVTCFKLALVE